MSQGHLSEIEAGDVEASVTVLAQIARVLGGRLRLRIEPGGGPLLRDHLQAAMLEALLPLLDPRWARFLEVPVHRPVRGVIDLVLADQTANLLVATEIHSQIRRLEQQLRWANEKAAALANELDIAPHGAASPPTISRLLVLRSTAATRAIARTYGQILTAAYPADAREFGAALTGNSPWPAPGIVWMDVEHGRGPPHRATEESASGPALTLCYALGSMSEPQPRPRTLVEKIWDGHVVADEAGAPTILGIDLHLVHEVTSPQAFTGLRERGLTVRRPGQTVATADHSVPTHDRGLPMLDQQAAYQVQQLERNCRDFGIPAYMLGSEHQGIVHVIGPELGLTQPGMTIVCGDSHTATHGAFGALAFGIGTSEVEMVLATQCLLQRRPRTYEVRVDGRLRPGVSAKDIILALIARIGIAGGTGHVFEYTGEAIRALSMEERMTVCNMSIEGGARAGLIAPDDTTFDYLHGRRHAPQGVDWDAAVQSWRALPSDDGATYDASITLAAGDLEPMVTYGTNPGMGIPISGRVPAPAELPEPAHQRALEKALAYMALEPGQPLLGQRLDVVFIGSCTNSRISDLRQAAAVLGGRRVADGLRVLVVPGSQQVKAQAEREGLDDVFRAAGAEWREAGCSMCIAMNGDELAPGQYAISTSNRNFEGRQGKGGRTFLASPLTAAASALSGVISDPRAVMGAAS